MDKKELLGKRIKELRKAKNMKQEHLAEKLGIEPRQLSKLETGRHYPSFETVLGLLEVFEITFEELINYNHHKNEDEIKKEINEAVLNLKDEKLRMVYKFLISIGVLF